jgi:hypothetical protein
MRLLSIYGLMAEFEGPDQLLEAAKRAYTEGYRRMDAYSPAPVEGLAEAIGFKRQWMPLIVLLGALAGCAGGYYMQYWISVVDYPLNVGGRPYHSWIAFIPVTFEMTVLCGAFAALLGMLAINGLPMPYHPVFNVPSFKFASRNRFFLCIEARDPRFDKEATKKFLESLNAREVTEVNR